MLQFTNVYGFFKASRVTKTDIPIQSAATSMFANASTRVASKLFQSRVSGNDAVPV